jgi:predicted Rossmann fold nucleotide-binding protein DprA/Smf involved in DNA uptake
MRRNRYIYNLADYGLIASSSSGSGGTWQGAVEAIRNREAVFVWLGGKRAPNGNHELIKKGALPFPESPRSKLVEELKKLHSLSRAREPLQERLIEEEAPVYSMSQTTVVEPEARYGPLFPLETAYEAVLSVMLHHLREPKNSKNLAQLLDVGEKQAQAWLKKAVEEKKVQKQTRPTRYIAAGDGNNTRHGHPVESSEYQSTSQ